MHNNDYYNKNYLGSIVKVGRIVLLFSMVYFFVPFLWTWLIKGIQPTWSAIATGCFLWFMINLPWYLSEPIAYFPVQGVTGMIICTLAGNSSNMRMPIAISTQKAVGVEPGTKEGTIIATIAIATTCFISIGILAIFILVGQALLNVLPESVTSAITFMLPALLGAVFAQFLIGQEVLGAIAMAIGLGIMLLGNNGFLSFIPGDGVYLVEMLLPIIGTIAIGILLEKNKQKKNAAKTE